jgi:hypothetical protein
MPTLYAASPCFAVPDIGITISWYEEKLGFNSDPFPEAVALAALWSVGIRSDRSKRIRFGIQRDGRLIILTYRLKIIV